MNLNRVALEVSNGMTCTFKARGHSMTPLIEDGEVVTIEPVRSRDVDKGDIVLAHVNGSWLLHKVSAAEENRVQISNNHGRVNGWATRRNVVGKLKKKA